MIFAESRFIGDIVKRKLVSEIVLYEVNRVLDFLKRSAFLFEHSLIYKVISAKVYDNPDNTGFQHHIPVFIILLPFRIKIFNHSGQRGIGNMIFKINRFGINSVCFKKIGIDDKAIILKNIIGDDIMHLVGVYDDNLVLVNRYRF